MQLEAALQQFVDAIAAHPLPEDLREDYVQPHVGHYGVFNGRRFREEIYPRVAAFIARQEARIAAPSA